MILNEFRNSLWVVLLSLFLQIGCSTSTKFEHPIKESLILESNTVWLILSSGEVVKLSNNEKRKVVPAAGVMARKLFFLNENEGWILDGTGQLWATNDGGQEWRKRGDIHNDLTGTTDELLFIDRQVGWLTFGGAVLLTEDGGESWRNIPLPEPAKEEKIEFPTRIHAIGVNKAFVGMDDGRILFTQDRGKSWELRALPEKKEVTDLFAVDDRKVWVTTQNGGGLFFSETGGQEWQQVLDKEVKDNLGMASISFGSPEIGWLAGRELEKTSGLTGNANGRIFRTTDGGRTWTRQNCDLYKTPFQRVRFFDNRRGWLVGDSSIYRTEDEGVTWSQVFSAN